MKPFFRWHTEDESDWEEEPPAAGKSPVKRWVFLLLGLLIASAGLIYWRQMRQVAQEEQRIQDDVLAAFHTWQQAVINDDFDLFVRLISPQSADWQNGQRQLFWQNLLLDRQQLGLTSLTAPENVAIDLGDDWQTAELTYEQLFTAVSPTPPTNAIRLQQTQLYQRDDSRWRQAPPDAAFWGA
ncbi:MAG: hypothetical protein P8183_22820, partial [Anaerolineae bacterium]